MGLTDLLTDARDYIECGWTQETDARDVYGYECSPDDPAAQCWCLSGALIMAAHGDDLLYCRAVDYLKDELALPEDVLIVDWNDVATRTQADVLELLDRAIERSRQMTTPQESA